MEDIKNMDDETLEKFANAIVKGIAYTENGGEPPLDNPVAGPTGEMKSIFQFMPDTWDMYSKEVFGKEMPLNKENETYVVQQKVKKWLKEGRTAKQIGSMWNAGTGEPDAYLGKFKMTTKTHKAGDPSVGMLKGKNGKPVKMDVPGYAEKLNNYASQFFTENESKMNTPKMSPEISRIAPDPKAVSPVKKEGTNIVNNFLKTLLPSGLSVESVTGAQKASAMEKPSKPAVAPVAPVTPPAPEAPATFTGLLGGKI